MVIIKERKLLRCCYNCVNKKNKDGLTCDATPYGHTVVEPTGICEYFIRVS